MEIRCLGDLCDIKSGGTPSKGNSSFWTGPIPWVSPKDMRSSEIEDAIDHISEKAIEGSAASTVPAQAILVVVRSGVLAHTLPVAKTLTRVSFNQDIKAFIPRKDLIDADYLYWFIRSRASDVIARGVKKGATVHSVMSRYIEQLSVPIPARNEQSSIADLLTRAEGIVRLRREAQKKAAELIPALFLGIFGDPASNPKDWVMGELGDILARADYGTSKKASPDGSGVCMLRMGNVTTLGDLDLSDLKHVQLAPADIEKYRLEAGDLLFNRTNSKELVGKTGIWDNRFEAVAASYFIRLRADRSQVEPHFVWAWMNTRHMKRRLFEIARGAIGQSNINARELRSLPIFVPPLRLQQEFVQHIGSVRALQFQQQDARGKAQSAFDALLHRAFAA